MASRLKSVFHTGVHQLLGCLRVPSAVLLLGDSDFSFFNLFLWGLLAFGAGSGLASSSSFLHG